MYRNRFPSVHHGMSQGYVQPRIITSRMTSNINHNVHLVGEREVGGGQQGVVVEGDEARVGADLGSVSSSQFSPLVRAAQLVSVSHTLNHRINASK